MPIPKLNITESNSVSIDYSQLKDELFINIDNEYKKPPICIEICQNGNKYRFGTFGNFSVIGGKGKAKKGFLVSAIIGSSLTGEKILNFKTYFNGKKIVLFDTEQGNYDLYVASKRSVRLNQFDYHPENLDVFALRQLSTEDRVTFIENYLEEEHQKLGMIVIDGVRDLIVDINNTDQSTEITTKIMQWTKIYNIHAVLVLHENPGSDKLRGHLGTELTNKAETVISVEKQQEREDVSMVIPKFTRGTMPFNQFSFEIDETGLPILSNFIPVF